MLMYRFIQVVCAQRPIETRHLCVRLFVCMQTCVYIQGFMCSYMRVCGGQKTMAGAIHLIFIFKNTILNAYLVCVYVYMCECI